MTAGVRYGVGVLLTALGLVVATAGLVAMVTPGLGPEPQAVEPIDLDETDRPTATPSPSGAPRSGADERGAVAIGPPGGAEDAPSHTDATRERDTADAEPRTGVAALDVVAAGSTPAPGGQDGAEPVDTPAVADVPSPDVPSPDPSPDVPSPEPTPEVPSPEPTPVPAPDPTPQEPAPSPDPGADPDLDPVAWRDDDRDDVPDDDADPEPDGDDDSKDSDHSRDDSHDTDDSHDEAWPPGHARHDPAGDHDSRHARAHDNH